MALSRVLDRMHLEYRIISDTKADIYGSVEVTELTISLHDEGCIVRSMQEKDESLESYYINLVGGGDHA